MSTQFFFQIEKETLKNDLLPQVEKTDKKGTKIPKPISFRKNITILGELFQNGTS